MAESTTEGSKGQGGAGGKEPDALDLLEGEDRLLLRAFEELDAKGSDRFHHDTLAKFVIHHLAIREAAREDVVGALEAQAGAEAAELGAFVSRDQGPLREAIGKLHEMSRGTTAGELNLGQPFDAELDRARGLVDPEIHEELERVLPSLDRAQLADRLPSAREVGRHAPTHLRRQRPAWASFAPLVRLQAFYDQVQRNPTEARFLLPDDLVQAERQLGL